MISVYYMDTRRVEARTIAAMRDRLSEGERARLGNIRDDAARVATHYLSAQVVGAEIGYTDRGAPYAIGVRLSLSHANGYAAVAVSKTARAVGVDVEDGMLTKERAAALRTRYFPSDLSPRAPQDGEIRIFEVQAKFDTVGHISLSYTEQVGERVNFWDEKTDARTRFLCDWTCAEAIGKANGTGLASLPAIGDALDAARVGVFFLEGDPSAILSVAYVE